ncbi:Ger(x)C family spore germination C-terminal domain-containing protein [Bacillus sp. AFS017336]|uniref:Ger(x)C family spore germination protein n=1 Tax=Bacillus sp. AFS017336 TaxID=2033489 RepID=UPI000BF0FB21|nr:Ger(x)C family spore germination C-terminal domain-containing protein [Bacillus sp. AFS017336]PEK98139.1 hypothetical protein CN601_26165 [Bacillus sp. AFS017336]
MRKIACFILILPLFFLTGCYGKNIKNQIYVTSIGIDYKNGLYTVLIEALNFSNVAKTEGATAVAEPVPALIGTATDESIQGALNQLHKKTVEPLFLGQVNSVILTKNVIEKKMNEVVPFLSQKSLLRYSTWLFGTVADLKDIYQSEAYFNQSNIYTIYHDPEEQSRLTMPNLNLKYNRFISRYSEPVGTILIPSLAIDETHFKEKKNRKIAYQNGAFVISHKQYKGFVDLDSLSGFRWFGKYQTATSIETKEKKASMKVLRTKHSIKVLGKNKPTYNITVRVSGIIETNLNHLHQQKLEKEFASTIRNEINQTLKKGEELGVDLLNLNEKPYQFSLKKWNEKDLMKVDRTSIKQLQVNVHIEGSETYK